MMQFYWIGEFIEEIPKAKKNIFLTSEIKEFLNNIHDDVKNKELLERHNISIKNKILLYWKPWNWKTTLAQYIWESLWYDVFKIKTWSIIDSSMWKSWHNIQKIFSQLKWECVVLIDEIDSFCTKRNWTNDSSAMTENDRVVNQFIIWLDNLDKDVILVWATNLHDKLDNAILRRFQTQYNIKDPTREQKEDFKNQLLKFCKIKVSDSKKIQFELDDCETYSDIELYVIEKIRKFLILKW